MYKKVIAAILATAGLVSAAPAMAEGPFMVRARAVYIDFDNDQSAGLPLGGVVKVEADSLWIPEVDLSYFFTKNLAAELVLTYPQKIDIKATTLGTIGEIKALPPSLLLQYHFTDLGMFKPYVGLGVNYTVFTKRSFRSDELGGAKASVDRSSVGVAAQVGADFLIDKNWSVNVDAKYIKMDTDVKINGTKIGEVGLDPWTLGVGVGYRF